MAHINIFVASCSGICLGLRFTYVAPTGAEKSEAVCTEVLWRRHMHDRLQTCCCTQWPVHITAVGCMSAGCMQCVPEDISICCTLTVQHCARVHVGY